MSETKQQPGLIYGAISKVMSEMDAVGKRQMAGGESGPKYKYRAIEDIQNALHGALAKNGVFLVPEVLHEEHEDRTTSGGKPVVVTHLGVRYTFYASDGSSVSATTYGEGADSGDKGTNKAMSASLKYLLMFVFMIPTEDAAVDSEKDTHEYAPRENASAHRTAPEPHGEKRSAPAEEHAAPPAEKERTPEDEAIRQAWGKIYGAIENVFGIDDKDGKRAKARELAAQEYPDRKPGTLTVAELDAIRNVINRRADMAASDLPLDQPKR